MSLRHAIFAFFLLLPQALVSPARGEGRVPAPLRYHPLTLLNLTPHHLQARPLRPLINAAFFRAWDRLGDGDQQKLPGRRLRQARRDLLNPKRRSGLVASYIRLSQRPANESVRFYRRLIASRLQRVSAFRADQTGVDRVVKVIRGLRAFRKDPAFRRALTSFLSRPTGFPAKVLTNFAVREALADLRGTRSASVSERGLASVSFSRAVPRSGLKLMRRSNADAIGLESGAEPTREWLRRMLCGSR